MEKLTKLRIANQIIKKFDMKFLPEEGGVFALLGATVTPAFKFEQYQSALTYKKELLEKHPGMSDFIAKLI